MGVLVDMEPASDIQLGAMGPLHCLPDHPSNDSFSDKEGHHQCRVRAGSLHRCPTCVYVGQAHTRHPSIICGTRSNHADHTVDLVLGDPTDDGGAYCRWLLAQHTRTGDAGNIGNQHPKPTRTNQYKHREPVMNGYLLLGYAVSLVLMWGYAMQLYRKSRNLRLQKR